MYSLPCIFFCLIAGQFISRHGTRLSIALFTTLAITGTIVFAFYSASSETFKMSLIGRSIYGLGAEGQIIWVQVIICTWFHYSEVPIATIIAMTVGKFGSMFADMTSPVIYR